MVGLLHQTLSGLATGGIYASVALALVMVYRATGHINFAQGEMATFFTYIALSLIQAGVPYWARSRRPSWCRSPWASRSNGC